MAPTDRPASDSPPELMIEDRPVERRRCFWFGLAVMWAFALVFLLYGLIDALAPPASERVNNGEHGTFFAVHINPYYEFSEDFHLYGVRAKRVAERGWTNAPLYAPPGEVEAKADYTAPLQVLLMRLAILTDGRPIPYAVFMTTVLGVAWTMLYLAAARWMHRSVSPLAIPIALTVTLLFESISGLIHPINEYAQWPVHRGLRMATLGWSCPLILALAIAAASLVMQPAKCRGRVVFITILLAALALADVWGFLLAGGCVALLAALLVIRLLWQVTWGGNDRGALAISIAGVVLAGLVGLAVRGATTSPLDADVLTRAGIGTQWIASPFGLTNSKWVPREAAWEIKVLAGLFALFCVYGATSLNGNARTAHISLRLGLPSQRRMFLGVMACLAALAPVVVGAVLSRCGVEYYHIYQFMWRADLITLFCVALALTECAKLSIRFLAKHFGAPCFPWEFAGAVAMLGVLFVYHGARTYEFVARMAAREFFLTADEEHLRDWLRKREPTAGRETLATASHELNYLCAYWTNADLLLPEGFPYHNHESNAAIERRMARLLAVYGATPARWTEFNLHRHGSDQWSWAVSRLLSARQGYMYYLLHRGIGVDGSLGGRPQSSQPKFTTGNMAEERLARAAHVEAGDFRVHKSAVDSVQRIASLLELKPTLSDAERPQVIIVDEVSRFLGSPDLADYHREFRRGSLEAWVLRGTTHNNVELADKRNATTADVSAKIDRTSRGESNSAPSRD